MDKNSRTLEKVKKFGDKLKDELDAFVKERTSKLDESAVALTVEQTKAVAAVKRLESIRDDLAKKEADLMERTKSVENFGKQISAYDSTIKQLVEMTALAETNLQKITAESDFADSLGKKLAASQKQLADISASIPALQDAFARENRASLESIQGDTLARISGTIADLEARVNVTHKSGVEIADQAVAQLRDVYQKAFVEASKRADGLEDAAFAKLKEQASERLQRYKEQIEEKTSALHELTKERISETQQLAKGFKSDWQGEANDFLEATRAEIRQFSADYENAIASLSDKLKSAETLGETRAEEFRAELNRFESDLRKNLAEISSSAEKRTAELAASIETVSAKTGKILDEATGSIDDRLSSYASDVDARLARFDGLIEDVGRLDGQLRLAMQKTEQRVTEEFNLYAQDQQSKRDAFAKNLLDGADALSARMVALETGLNELKARAYDNVSEKLKMFEDDFFADLAKRSDAITASLEGWKTTVAERLDSLTSESESARKDLEASYSVQLKDRLAEIAEQHRAHTAKLEEQLAAVETELRGRITASDQSILSFIEQSRAEFAQAKDTAALHVKNELDAHALSVQEIIRKQQREVESRTKEFTTTIDAARADAEATLAGIKSDFSSWQMKNDQLFADAAASLDARLAKLDSSSKESAAALESAWQTNFRDFAAKTADERKALKDGLDALKKDIAAATADFHTASANLVAEADRRIRETGAETEQTVKNIRSMVQEVRDTVDSTREKLLQKLQSDTGALGQTIEAIDKQQKAFIAQTKIFDRADELRSALESGIDTLKGELGRLDVYRDTMGNLEQQYQKVRKLEEEATQKLAKFTADRKRIDLLEADFGKLLGLSDSMDKKIAELTGTNDDLQQFQVQIRRFEESLSEVSSRYERLEKKSPVLEQTTSGVDKAFEHLKALESSVTGFRAEISGIPAELDAIKRDLDTLLANKEKTSTIVEKISAIDSILDDVDKRASKLQSSREWLARTETRLEEISKQSEDQLKLLGSILKEDGPAKKTKGAPPIGIRENVVKLSHQGWNVDEIARALHLSRGEVELILELPSK
jgi:chromosome segregation ATPase